MIVFLKRLPLLLLVSYLFQLTIADNDTDYHSNETMEYLSSTLISLTTVGNAPNDDIVIDDHKNDTAVIDDNKNVTTLIDDISTSATFVINSTLLSTSIPLETTAGNVIESNTTLSEDNDLTTVSIQLNETQVFTEKNQVETTSASNTSCETSKYGCCKDGITERQGSNNEGCSDETTVPPVSNTTVKTDDEIGSVSTVEIINATIATEESNTTVESSTENIVVVTNESTSMEINLDNSTAVAVDAGTTESFSETTKTEVIDTTAETTTTTTTARSNLCVDSEFECCPDGKTAAQGSEFQGCNTTEKWTLPMAKASLKSVCELEKDPGSCSKYVNMWAYDNQQGKCIRFWYGSCEGNGNRFETEQQCQETCISPKGIEVCLLPKITGPCHSAGNRYYYDRDKKECQQFRYGGCNGNANNYDSLEKCQSTCAKETVDQCTQPVEVGPCKGEYTRFYYDTITGQCRSFLYGGCKKNKNNFLTLKDCLKTCVEPRQKDICLRPKVIGTCQERRPTWYFDMIQQECKLFQYSGCGGNHNQFSNKEECELSCSSLKKSKNLKDDIQSICNLSMARGSCDQQLSRWYYNPNDQYCHSFQYTGCHGNANSFETEKDCREICQAKEKDICVLEKDSGSCDQYKMMWYYDSFSKQCKNFFYGSCGGNANRFATEEECQIRCLIKPGNSTCLQQVDQGYACNNTKSNKDVTATPILKFFYDQQLRKCSSFLYQGCGGNDNRFDEENQCNEKCVQDTSVPQQSCGSNLIRCNIQCRFGFERDANGCEICRCIEPCQRQQCPMGYECITIPEQSQCLQAPCPVPRVECQPISADQMGRSGRGMKPIIENAITNIFSPFDANVTIPCTLRQGYPAPVIYWYKERQQLQVHEAMSSGIIVRKIERLPDQSLIIRKISLEDQGLYTCRAINEFGEDIKDVQLEIFDPIKVEIYPINRIYQLGFTAKLQCRAAGYPSPRTIWMRDNVPLANTTRITVQNDGSLVIHPYKQEDAGPYVCNATNKKESVTQVAYLEVKETHVEPVCEDQPAFANCELVVRHNFCDVYFDYCCRTCSQQGQYASSSPLFEKSTKQRYRRQVFLK